MLNYLIASEYIE